MALDWKAPDYRSVIVERAERLNRIRQAGPAELAALNAYYRDNIPQFINDWGMTLDPVGERGLIPFILFERQRELVEWLLDHLKQKRPGLVEKSRQTGVSWLTMAVACSLCVLGPGMAIGVGSRKAELVDSLGDPKSLFEKARIFLAHLPTEFRAGFDVGRDAPYMKVAIPQTGSTIVGESGDQIGRGGTFSMYIVDEAAFLERPELVERSLALATPCRIDVSTPNGRANAFAEKRFSGRVDLFQLRWNDDPRRDDTWYAKQAAELDPVTLAQEVDIDYYASTEGAVIPSSWIQSSIDAHLKLGIQPSGDRRAALDVADEGADANALCARHGVVVDVLEEWSGRGSDILRTVVKAFALCDDLGCTDLHYDADGLGAGVRGDALKINEERVAAGRPAIRVTAFRASAEVFKPDAQDVPGRKNKDYFASKKAQAWWQMRRRFEATHRAVVGGERPFDADAIVSISGNLKHRHKLMAELSQVTHRINTVGKIVIDKNPEGTRSPNLADALVMAFARTAFAPMRISQEALALAGQRVTA
jgi:phage terminase large subunit